MSLPVWRKTFRDLRELAQHVEALRAFGEHRAVAVLETLPDERAVLLERATPGESLASTATEDGALRVVARLLEHGWPSLPIGSVAEPLAEFASSLTAIAAGRREFARPAGVLRELLENAPPPLLLHGDLHYGNIVTSERAGHLLIDPKGVAGDPAFDIGYLVSRAMPRAKDELRFAIAIDGRLAFLPAATGLDPRRVAAFAYVAAALSAAWAFEDADSSVSLCLESMHALSSRT
jgi:streptomycin 6-kinase